MRRGFTLLEILIAMAVFTVGVISILAVFPVGIKSSTQSTDHSVAAALAESLDDALTLALRQYSGVAGGPTGVPVDFFHDGLPNGAGKFHLPPLETWKDSTGAIGPVDVVYVANGRSQPTWYPFSSLAAAPFTPNGTTYAHAIQPTNVHVAPARLGSVAGTEDKNGNGVLDAGEDKNGNGQLDIIVGEQGADFPDPLRQYSFRFMCHEYKTPNDSDADEDPTNDSPNDAAHTRVPPAVPPIQTYYKQFEYQNGTEAEVIDRLYQFTVYIYRGWKDTTCDSTNTLTPPGTLVCWPGPVNYDWEDQMKHPNKIERFEFLIYSQGAEQQP